MHRRQVLLQHTTLSAQLLFQIYGICVGALYVCQCTVCVPGATEARRQSSRVTPLELESQTVGRESPGDHWGPNKNPLEEQQVLSTPEPSLHHPALLLMVSSLRLSRPSYMTRLSEIKDELSLPSKWDAPLPLGG